MRDTEKRERLARIFKKYARLGLADKRLDVFEVCFRIYAYTHRGRASQESEKREARELFAVWETCRLLTLCGKRESLRIFEEAYLRGKANSALSIANKYHCDERTVYRHLSLVEKNYEAVRRSLK